MKIIPNPPLHPPSNNKSPSVQEQSHTNFQKVFDKALASSSETGKASASTTVATSLAGINLQTVDAFHPHSNTQIMDRFIDVLESYQQNLDNPRTSLRDLEPTLRRLEKEHARLSRLVESSNIDNDLLSIMNQGLVISATEISRFHSGAYC